MGHCYPKFELRASYASSLQGRVFETRKTLRHEIVIKARKSLRKGCVIEARTCRRGVVDVGVGVDTHNVVKAKTTHQRCMLGGPWHCPLPLTVNQEDKQGRDARARQGTRQT